MNAPERLAPKLKICERNLLWSFRFLRLGLNLPKKTLTPRRQDEMTETLDTFASLRLRVSLPSASLVHGTQCIR